MHHKINGASLPQDEKGARGAYSKSSSEVLHKEKYDVAGREFFSSSLLGQCRVIFTHFLE